MHTCLACLMVPSVPKRFKNIWSSKDYSGYRFSLLIIFIFLHMSVSLFSFSSLSLFICISVSLHLHLCLHLFIFISLSFHVALSRLSGQTLLRSRSVWMWMCFRCLVGVCWCGVAVLCVVVLCVWCGTLKTC